MMGTEHNLIFQFHSHIYYHPPPHRITYNFQFRKRGNVINFSLNITFSYRAILRLSILWLVAGCCAAAPFFDDNYFGEHFYGTNGVCLSIHIHDPLGQVCHFKVQKLFEYNPINASMYRIPYNGLHSDLIYCLEFDFDLKVYWIYVLYDKL